MTTKPRAEMSDAELAEFLNRQVREVNAEAVAKGRKPLPLYTPERIRAQRLATQSLAPYLEGFTFTLCGRFDEGLQRDGILPETPAPDPPLSDQEVLRDPLRGGLVVWFMLTSIDRDLPELPHYVVARRTLQLLGREDNPDEQLSLAKELARAIRPLLEALGLDKNRPPEALTQLEGGVPVLSLRLAKYLKKEFGDLAKDWTRHYGTPIGAGLKKKPTTPDALKAKDSNGPEPAFLKHARTEHDRLKKQRGEPASKISLPGCWHGWIQVDGLQMWSPALDCLCRGIWETKFKTWADPPRFYIPGVKTDNGDQYVRLEKTFTGISWAIGGHGLKWEGAKVGPDDYVMVPSSYQLVTDKLRTTRAHQLQLPLLEKPLPLVVSATGMTGIVIKPLTGKLAFLSFATARPDGLGAVLPLREVTKMLHPARRIDVEDDRATAQSLLELKTLHVVLANGNVIQCLDTYAPMDPSTATADTPVGWAWGRFFHAAVQVVKQVHGRFIANLTGAMKLDTRKPLLRYYARFASMWNDAHMKGRNDPILGAFDPNLVPAYTPEEIAAYCNQLSPTVAKFMATDKNMDATVKRRFMREKKTAFKYVKELEGKGLVRIEKPGRRSRGVKVLPPGAYFEAYAKVRRHRKTTP